MEEQIQTNREDENLNSIAKLEETLETNPSQKTFSEEEVEAIKKEMASNTEKGVQKLLREIRLLRDALEELSNIECKNERLVDLADENTELANLLLELYFKESLDEYKERIWYTKDLEDPRRFYKRLEREAAEKANDRIIEIEKQRFVEKLQMQDDERKNFEEVFESLRNSREIDLNKLDSIFEKSYSIANIDTMPSRALLEQESIWKLMSITAWGKGSSKMTRADREAKIGAEVKEFLLKHKLI